MKMLSFDHRSIGLIPRAVIQIESQENSLPSQLVVTISFSIWDKIMNDSGKSIILRLTFP